MNELQSYKDMRPITHRSEHRLSKEMICEQLMGIVESSEGVDKIHALEALARIVERKDITHMNIFIVSAAGSSGGGAKGSGTVNFHCSQDVAGNIQNNDPNFFKRLFGKSSDQI